MNDRGKKIKIERIERARTRERAPSLSLSRTTVNCKDGLMVVCEKSLIRNR